MHRVTTGTAIRFATGPTRGTVLNAGTVSGMVATCATMLAAKAGAAFQSARGMDARIQVVVSEPARTNPSTAQTDSANPKSNAASGRRTSMPMHATEMADKGSPRRPETMAPPAAASMMNARSVDARHPETPK
jgi:hypothetical protein